MKYLYTKPIASVREGMNLFRLLARQDKIFHPDDDPREIGIFTPEEAEAIDKRMDEVYKLDWSLVGLECPCGAAMHAEALEFLHREFGEEQGWSIGPNLLITEGNGVFYLVFGGPDSPVTLVQCTGSQVHRLVKIAQDLHDFNEGY